MHHRSADRRDRLAHRTSAPRGTPRRGHHEPRLRRASGNQTHRAHRPPGTGARHAHHDRRTDDRRRAAHRPERPDSAAHAHRDRRTDGPRAHHERRTDAHHAGRGRRTHGRPAHQRRRRRSVFRAARRPAPRNAPRRRLGHALPRAAPRRHHAHHGHRNAARHARREQRRAAHRARPAADSHRAGRRSDARPRRIHRSHRAGRHRGTQRHRPAILRPSPGAARSSRRDRHRRNGRNDPGAHQGVPHPVRRPAHRASPARHAPVARRCHQRCRSTRCRPFDPVRAPPRPGAPERPPWNHRAGLPGCVGDRRSAGRQIRRSSHRNARVRHSSSSISSSDTYASSSHPRTRHPTRGVGTARIQAGPPDLPCPARPENDERPPHEGWPFVERCPAASYSPTPWRVQYHRR